MAVSDDLDALAELGLRAALPAPENASPPRWARLAFAAGVCVSAVVVALMLVMVIPLIVRELAVVLGALPALVSG